MGGKGSERRTELEKDDPLGPKELSNDRISAVSNSFLQNRILENCRKFNQNASASQDKCHAQGKEEQAEDSEKRVI